MLKYFAAPRLAFLRLQLFHQRDRRGGETPPCVLPKSGSAGAFHTPLSRTLGHSTFLHFQICSAILGSFVFEEHKVLASHLKI